MNVLTAIRCLKGLFRLSKITSVVYTRADLMVYWLHRLNVIVITGRWKPYLLEYKSKKRMETELLTFAFKLVRS